MSRHLIPVQGQSAPFRLAGGADPQAAMQEGYDMLGPNRPIVTFAYGRNGLVSVATDTDVRAMGARLAEAIRTRTDYHMTPSTV